MMSGESWEHQKPEAENRTVKPPLAVDVSSVWTEATGAEGSIGLRNPPSHLKRGQKFHSLPWQDSPQSHVGEPDTSLGSEGRVLNQERNSQTLGLMHSPGEVLDLLHTITCFS